MKPLWVIVVADGQFWCRRGGGPQVFDTEGKARGRLKQLDGDHTVWPWWGPIRGPVKWKSLNARIVQYRPQDIE